MTVQSGHDGNETKGYLGIIGSKPYAAVSCNFLITHKGFDGVVDKCVILNGNKQRFSGEKQANIPWQAMSDGGLRIYEVKLD